MLKKIARLHVRHVHNRYTAREQSLPGHVYIQTSKGRYMTVQELIHTLLWPEQDREIKIWQDSPERAEVPDTPIIYSNEHNAYVLEGKCER